MRRKKMCKQKKVGKATKSKQGRGEYIFLIKIGRDEIARITRATKPWKFTQLEHREGDKQVACNNRFSQASKCKFMLDSAMQYG